MARADKRPTDVPRNEKEVQKFRDARPSTGKVRAEDQERLDSMLDKFPRRKGNRTLNWSEIRADHATMQTLRQIIVSRGDYNRAWLNNTKYKEVTDEIEGKP